MRARLFHNSRRFDLTARQEEVLRLVAEGRTNGEIADLLDISLDGVKYHIREILGKTGTSSREAAAAKWQAAHRERWHVPSWILAVAGAAAAAAVAIIVIALGTNGGPEEEVAEDETAAEPSATATTPRSVLTECDPSTVTYSLFQRPAGVEYSITAAAPGPCRLIGTVFFTITDTSGAPLTIKANRLPAAFDAPLPTDLPIASTSWVNWCGDDREYLIQVETPKGLLQQAGVEVPTCDPALPDNSYLHMAAKHFPPQRPEPPPLPTGYVEDTRKSPRVWVYEDSQERSRECSKLIPDMVPVSVAGKVQARAVECDWPSGVVLAMDTSGTSYVARVTVRAFWRATDIDPATLDGTCESMRPYLVLASEPEEVVVWNGWCDAVPLARGEVSTNPIVILSWFDRAQYGQGELPPPSTPCTTFLSITPVAGKEPTQPVRLACTLY